jgi:hypothetical protein
MDLHVATDALSVAAVRVTISPGAGDPFEPITALATFDGTRWNLSVTSVPAGPQRVVEVVALDADGNVAAAGSAQADVAPGGRLLVVIVLQAPSPPPTVNTAPVVDAIWALPGGVPVGGAANVGASAHDPNADAVSFLWGATCGAFDDATRAEATWTAPPSPGPCTLSITVSDSSGLSVTTAFVLSVL